MGDKFQGGDRCGIFVFVVCGIVVDGVHCPCVDGHTNERLSIVGFYLYVQLNVNVFSYVYHNYNYMC